MTVGTREEGKERKEEVRRRGERGVEIENEDVGKMIEGMMEDKVERMERENGWGKEKDRIEGWGVRG